MEQEGFSEWLQAIRTSGEASLADELARLAIRYPPRQARKLIGKKMLNNLLEKSKRQYVSPFEIARVYCQDLNDRTLALIWLTKAYQERSIGLPDAYLEPSFASLHSDPQFQDLMHKVGVVE
jgi:hypothetical protein